MKPSIMTVTGPILPEQMGLTLHHEHVMSTFGAESARYPDYDRVRLDAAVLPYLDHIKGLGVSTICDCTAAFFGRHPEHLRRFSLASGLQILTNTGYYGAADDRYVPHHAYVESADQIAARWIREWTDSIDETGIYPGFIKTAIDAGPLSEIDRKLIVAAARTHHATGLTIQTHSGDNVPAVEEALSILNQEEIAPNAWIWVHAHALNDLTPAIRAAEQGAWISFDGLDENSGPRILSQVQVMAKQGLLERVLLSHDGDGYQHDGGFRPYHYLLTDFAPMMRAAGISEAQIEQILVKNPAKAYTAVVRRQ